MTDGELNPELVCELREIRSRMTHVPRQTHKSLNKGFNTRSYHELPQIVQTVAVGILKLFLLEFLK